MSGIQSSHQRLFLNNSVQFIVHVIFFFLEHLEESSEGVVIVVIFEKKVVDDLTFRPLQSLSRRLLKKLSTFTTSALLVGKLFSTANSIFSVIIIF